MTKAIFFDMDGVLYDSMPNHEYSWTESFRAIGMGFRPEEAYANEGRTARATINMVYRREKGRDATDEEIEAIYAHKVALMRSRPQPEILPSMQDLLKRLPEMGIEVYIVTGSRQPSLIEKLHGAFGIERDHLISGEDVKYGKPDPEPYLMALKRTGYKQEECMVVENAPLGIASGKAAGLKVVAVNTGKLPDEELKASGADILFHDTEALARHIILETRY